MSARKFIQIAGKRVHLAHMRRSKKGAEVVGARVHIKGIGTVYVQVYEREEMAPPTPPSPPPPPPPTPSERRPPSRQADQIDQLTAEVLRALTDRLARLEKRAVILPEGTKIPDPRPSDGRH